MTCFHYHRCCGVSQSGDVKVKWHIYFYSSGHYCRWCSHIQVKTVAESLFVHCKIANFNSVTTEQWLLILLINFVTMRKALLTVSCKIFGWICMTQLKIHAKEFGVFIKDFVSPSGLFVPRTLTVMSPGHGGPGWQFTHHSVSVIK